MRIRKANLALGVIALCACSCSQDIDMKISPEEENLQTFIRDFGVPDPNHDWSMATEAVVTLKSSESTNAQIFAEINGERYIFASLASVKGTHEVSVVIPKFTKELIVVAHNTEKVCSVGATVDLDAMGQASSRSVFSYDTSSDAAPAVLKVGEETGTIEFDINDEANANLKNLLNASIDANGDIEYTNYKGETQNAIRDAYEVRWWHGTKEGKNDDFSVAPLYVRRNNPASTPDYEFGVRVGQWDTNVTAELTAENDLKIGYRTSADGDIIYTSQPSFDAGSRWVIPTSEFQAYNKGSDMGYGVLFSYKNAAGNETSSSYDTNHNNWGNNYFDVTVGGVSSFYTGVYQFLGLSLKDIEGKTYTCDVFGFYNAPTTNHQTLPSQPDAYFIQIRGDAGWVSAFGGGNIEYSWRIMAEDLGGSLDWDFNDLVVDFSVITISYLDFGADDNKFPRSVPEEVSNQFPDVKRVKVTARAAGGVMPIYLTWSGKMVESPKKFNGKKVSELITSGVTPAITEGDFLIGKEIHAWLGGQSDQMLNTKTVSSIGETYTFYAKNKDVNENGNEYDVNVGNGFKIVVDKDDNLGYTPDASGITQITLSEGAGYNVYSRPNLGDANPQVIIATQDVLWPVEKCRINVAYEGFNAWVESQYNGNDWYTTATSGNVVTDPYAPKKDEK